MGLVVEPEDEPHVFNAVVVLIWILLPASEAVPKEVGIEDVPFEADLAVEFAILLVIPLLKLTDFIYPEPAMGVSIGLPVFGVELGQEGDILGETLGLADGSLFFIPNTRHFAEESVIAVDLGSTVVVPFALDFYFDVEMNITTHTSIIYIWICMSILKILADGEEPLVGFLVEGFHVFPLYLSVQPCREVFGVLGADVEVVRVRLANGF